MDLSQLQRERKKWVDRNFGDSDAPHTSIMGATEEMLGEMIPLLLIWEALGRLNHHFIKAEAGIRGTPEEHKEAVKDAVGDCVVFLAGVCDHWGFDFGECVQQVWDQVKQRDWVANPEEGAA